MEHKQSGTIALLNVILGNLFEESFSRIVDIWILMQRQLNKTSNCYSFSRKLKTY